MSNMLAFCVTCNAFVITASSMGLMSFFVVNNVGCSLPYPQYFGETPLEVRYLQLKCIK